MWGSNSLSGLLGTYLQEKRKITQKSRVTISFSCPARGLLRPLSQETCHQQSGSGCLHLSTNPTATPKEEA